MFANCLAMHRDRHNPCIGWISEASECSACILAIVRSELLAATACNFIPESMHLSFACDEVPVLDLALFLCIHFELEGYCH